MTRYVSPASHVTASVHEHGVVLLHRDAGSLFTANRTGAHVWRRLAHGMSIDAIVEEISREHGIDIETIAEHTRLFVTALERAALVEPEFR